MSKNLDELIKAYAIDDKERILALYKENPNNKSLWYLMCRMCENNDTENLKWLVDNFNVSIYTVYEYDCFILKQCAVACNFTILRWLQEYFEIPSVILKKCNIYSCIENFNIDDLDGMIWFCEEFGLTAENIRNTCMRLPPINYSKSAEIKEKIGILVDTLDQGPLIKFAGKFN